MPVLRLETAGVPPEPLVVVQPSSESPQAEITATAMTTTSAAMTTVRRPSVDPMDMMTTNPQFAI